jgi:drug/metabolite transporter (DMT)-like permease
MKTMQAPASSPSPSKNRQVRDFVLLVIGATAIGNSSVLVRLAEADPAATSFWRVVFAIPVFIAWSWIESSRRTGGFPLVKLNRALILPALIAGLSFALDLTLSNVALGLTTMTSFIILVHLAPVFVVVVVWLWFGEKPTIRIVVALLLAILGAALLVQSGRASKIASNALLGDLASVAAAMGYAGFILATQRARMFGATGIVSLISAVSCAVFSLVFVYALGENLWPKSAYAWGMLALMGVGCHAFGQGLSAFAVGSLGSSVTSIVLVYAVAVTVAGGWLFFGEVPNLLQLSGGILVLTAVTLCRPKEQPAVQSPAQTA